MKDCEEPECVLLAEGRMENGKNLCMRHVAKTPGRFVLLPHDYSLLSESRQLFIPRYVRRNKRLYAAILRAMGA